MEPWDITQKFLSYKTSIRTQGSTENGNTDPENHIDAMCGNSVMYDAVNGKILTAGGSPSYQDSDATTNANVVTIGTVGNTPTVAAVGSMAFARAFANGVVLPNGKVFITGGQARPVPFSDATAVLTPELYDPATGRFTQLNPMAIPRVYHSWALLMPDATVYNGGGGLCGTCSTNHFDLEYVYRPKPKILVILTLVGSTVLPIYLNPMVPSRLDRRLTPSRLQQSPLARRSQSRPTRP